MPENLNVRTGDQLINLNMNLFGIPYQFHDAVDPRVNGISATIGKKFAENIMLEAPICTLIPGTPKYLPNTSIGKSQRSATALLEATNGNFSSLSHYMENGDLDNLRLYDFQPSYTEYMNYVNTLCAAGASFLGLEETTYVGSREVHFQNFDWKNYKWNNNANKTFGNKFSTVVDSIRNGGKSAGSFGISISSNFSETLKELATNYQYVQFYIDPETGGGDSLNNQTTESSMKSLFDQGSNTMKEIAFMANSGGINTETFNQFATDSAASLQSAVGSILGNSGGVAGAAGGVLSRLINLSGDVIKGHNLIIPDIYQNSQYQKGSATITVHLKSPYGTKLSYYLNIFVPMMHLMCFAMPRMESANSYSSPFLIKGYVEGLNSINLGIVSDISIQKISDSFSADGLPMEVDISLNIIDLYSDLCMTSVDAPAQFVNNSSLIEYLATNCGMSLTKPNYEAKYNMVVNSVINKFTSIPGTIESSVQEKIYSWISNVTNLYK